MSWIRHFFRPQRRRPKSEVVFLVVPPATPGEVTEVGSVRIALQGEASDVASLRIEVLSEVAQDASLRIALQGEVAEDVSVRIALQGEAAGVASLRIEVLSEVTQAASLRLALQGEVPETASLRIALQGEVAEDVSVRIALQGESTDDVSLRVAPQAEVASTVSLRIEFEGPVTISGVQFPAENYYCGPFLSDGSVYVVLLDSADNSLIEVHKDSGPFTEQDSANKPDVSATVRSMWAYQNGTDLHIAHQASDGRVGYSVFHMSTDLWDGTIIDEQVDAPSGTLLDKGVSIAVRSDGDVIVLYLGSTDDVGGERQRVDYARREGGTWTFGIAVDNGGAVDWFGAVIVRGSDDRMHFFFKEDPSDDGFQRTLTADNVLEAFPAAGDTTVTLQNHAFGPGVSYNDGGTQRVRAPYVNSDLEVYYAEFDSVDAPGAFTQSVAISSDDIRLREATGVMSLAVDGTDLHLLWARITGHDLHHVVNNGINVLILEGTMNRVSSNIYNRNGRKLAYLYADTDIIIKYNELDLSLLIALQGASTRIALLGELAPNASARIALLGEVTPQASVRYALQGDTVTSASARFELQGATPGTSSLNIGIQSEAVDIASLNVGLQGESIDDASVRLALLGEAIAAASLRAALLGVTSEDASLRIVAVTFNPGEVTAPASMNIVLPEVVPYHIEVDVERDNRMGVDVEADHRISLVLEAQH